MIWVFSKDEEGCQNAYRFVFVNTPEEEALVEFARQQLSDVIRDADDVLAKFDVVLISDLETENAVEYASSRTWYRRIKDRERAAKFVELWRAVTRENPPQGVLDVITPPRPSPRPITNEARSFVAEGRKAGMSAQELEEAMSEAVKAGIRAAGEGRDE